LIEGLFLEGAKDMATMSPGTVARLITLLERALVEHGVMPESKRSRDPQGYVRTLKSRQTREWESARAPLRNEEQENRPMWALARQHNRDYCGLFGFLLARYWAPSKESKDTWRSLSHRGRGKSGSRTRPAQVESCV